jgi:hypothetical protein
LQLGQRVRFERVLERQCVEVECSPAVPKFAIPARTRWERHWLPVEREGEGIVTGLRSLTNGWSDYDPEEGHTWNHTGHVRCALVTVSLHRKPVPVPLDALESMEVEHV